MCHIWKRGWHSEQAIDKYIALAQQILTSLNARLNMREKTTSMYSCWDLSIKQNLFFLSDKKKNLKDVKGRRRGKILL